MNAPDWQRWLKKKAVPSPAWRDWFFSGGWSHLVLKDR
ncbi:hypothetical protein DAQ1742_01919 [Dickeya aquatica]|uniref:Uncharacterized protein n=1 Tax=Dickeya aquatica TaxID=1401087 RepID=A0A375AB84_9GAMM|nr:hypothetical protein DAQ1742_01919 [Dickeya aquatica]